MFAFYQH